MGRRTPTIIGHFGFFSSSGGVLVGGFRPQRGQFKRSVASWLPQSAPPMEFIVRVLVWLPPQGEGQLVQTDQAAHSQPEGHAGASQDSLLEVGPVQGLPEPTAGEAMTRVCVIVPELPQVTEQFVQGPHSLQTQSTGQAVGLQPWFIVDDPSQTAPPSFSGTDFLALVCVPLPQGLLHSPQGSHSLQVQSIGQGG